MLVLLTHGSAKSVLQCFRPSADPGKGLLCGEIPADVLRCGSQLQDVTVSAHASPVHHTSLHSVADPRMECQGIRLQLLQLLPPSDRSLHRARDL